MTMQEMLALGAPVLPSGYFYRIGIASFGYHKISIRKSCRFGSKKIVSVIFHVDNYAEKSCEKLIKTAAEKAIHYLELLLERQYPNV